MTASEEKLQLHEDLVRAAQEKKYFSGAQEECDGCKRTLAGSQYMVDGNRGGTGAWGNYCAACYDEPKSLIGWGFGQLYKHSEDGRWLQVGGFQPPKLDSEG